MNLINNVAQIINLTNNVSIIFEKYSQIKSMPSFHQSTRSIMSKAEELKF